jgi:hypothetical protein
VQPTQIPAGEHVAGKVVELGGGARVIFADEPAEGSRLGVQTADAPAETAGRMTLATPVKLTMVTGSVGRGATIEFPIPAGLADDRLAGIATYDERTQQWRPVEVEVDRAAGVVRTFTAHFSWWQPWTWDWAAVGARVNQNVGELIGKRAGEPTCHRGQAVPNWVAQLVGVSKDAGLAVRACAEGEDGVLAVELVNNRPYGQVLTYGSAVKWGWHEKGESALDQAANAAMDSVVGRSALYLPPDGRASVGVTPVAAGKIANFYVGPTAASLFVDVLKVAAEKVLSKVGSHLGAPLLATCGAAAVANVPVAKLRSAEDIWGVILSSFECGKQAFLRLAASGVIDAGSRDALLATLDGFKKATLVGRILTFYDVEWKVLDLVVDQTVVGGVPTLGNGFSIRAKAAPAPSTGHPTPAPPANPGPPTPPPPNRPQPPAPHPVTVYDNYGAANAGHAMCRGNPALSVSMPGGTASQSFTVPAGVSTLSGALVQIDPAAEVTAHLSVAVNGAVLATATAVAAGDTRFGYGPVPVSPDQRVTLSISFTATGGKIITVYTAGAPGGVFTAVNSCPDGAPSLSTSSTGLRAVVTGSS